MIARNNQAFNKRTLSLNFKIWHSMQRVVLNSYQCHALSGLNGKFSGGWRRPRILPFKPSKHDINHYIVT